VLGRAKRGDGKDLGESFLGLIFCRMHLQLT
jgi:hypothetical protein